MTKEDIKKAFVICCSSKNDCSGCPILELERKNGHKCKYNLFKGALDLITEQEKENERLKENLKNLKDDFESLQKDYEFVRDCDAEHCLEIEETVKQAKIDVLNELKDKMFEREYMGVKYKERIFYESEIDDMIVEVQNGKIY